MPCPSPQDFIDDELLRAPMSFDAVIDAVHARWQLRLPAHDRRDGNPARALQLHRGELLAEALRALRASAQADLQNDSGEVPRPVPVAAARVQRPALSLIDEDDVVVDIEIARCVQTVLQLAETELRELHTFTSALVLDVNVARNTNPFRPDRFVRALWSGVQRVPLSRPVLTAFMHEAALPLAQALRGAYGSACRRLEAQGVVPAAHRTIVYGSAPAWGTDLVRYRPPSDLHTLHDSMPASREAPVRQTPSPRPPTSAPSASRSAGSSPDGQLIELLARLFTAIKDDSGLASDTVGLLKPLQAVVLRLALRDPSLLDAYDHPVWRFMDHLASDLECSAPARQARLLGLCRNLVDHIAAGDPPDTRQFSWAIVRLAAARRHALAQALTSAAPQIEKLQRFAAAEALPSTANMPLDIGTLDTVPADLLAESDDAARPLGAHALAQASTPGTTLRIYLQGEWRQLMTLWQDGGHELLLLVEPASDRLWALRQPALVRLLVEGLARPLHVRSLVRRAAGRVLHAL